MSCSALPPAETVRLVDLCARSNAAFMNGDARGCVTLLPHADDFALMKPFGGPPSRGFDTSDERFAELRRYFARADTSFEVVATYGCSGLAVIVAIERQRAVVGGLPEQEWSLRVTLVLRREADGRWRLVHRHADPLLRDIGLERAAEIARG